MKAKMKLWVPLLLADPSPSLRFLVLRDLLAVAPEKPELRESGTLREGDPRVRSLLDRQMENGAWSDATGRGQRGTLYRTSEALTRLGYLGFTSEFPPVQRGVDFLFSQQRVDGSWPMAGEVESSERYHNYDLIPLQTAIPLRSLCWVGLAEHPRAERAFSWLIEQRLPDGAWPTGLASGNYAGVAGYRRLPHSRWGCRTNTTEVARCLALHPVHSHGEISARALDLLLGRETQERATLGLEVARTIGAEPTRGFFTYHAQHDPALLLDLSWRVGVSRDDRRVLDLISFVKKAQGEFGMWEYPTKPQATRWVTFDLLRSLSNLQERSEWISLEPPTPFRAYLRPPKRH